MHRSLRRTFFGPVRPTLTSRSLQSITRPFQKRFREVFGNQSDFDLLSFFEGLGRKIFTQIYLGWFFLVFGEGKVTKEKK